jgi:hypothetical protein
VGKPESAFGARGFPAADGYGELRALVTKALKQRQPGAQVLGAGPFSDSQFELSPLGIRNVCTPRRRVDVVVECRTERCGLELVARGDQALKRSRTVLPRLSSDRDLEVAIAQLLDDQDSVLR